MRVELGPLRPWRHELGHCLHATMGVLLGFHGLDPLEVLGAGWEFWYPPGDVRREEYYFPCRRGSLLRSLAPHHDVDSEWHLPDGPVQGWEEIQDRLTQGYPVAVAVDNFHLPFRPAFQDVHTNHLLTVYGFDDDAGTALLADPVPPSFAGPVPRSRLAAARDSDNPVLHERDMFFTANPIANRWLDVRVGPVQPAFGPAFVRDAVAANVRGFRDGSGEPAPAYHGLAGEEAFLAGAVDGLVQGDRAVDELFVVAGTALATAGVHAGFLSAAGRRLGRHRLVEAARQVDRVAHHWAAARIAVATARPDPPSAAASLRRRFDALLVDHERAVTMLEAALDQLAA
jgi:Butirosin biosynthesis protein H, N-terminal